MRHHAQAAAEGSRVSHEGKLVFGLPPGDKGKGKGKGKGGSPPPWHAPTKGKGKGKGFRKGKGKGRRKGKGKGTFTRYPKGKGKGRGGKGRIVVRYAGEGDEQAGETWLWDGQEWIEWDDNWDDEPDEQEASPPGVSGAVAAASQPQAEPTARALDRIVEEEPPGLEFPREALFTGFRLQDEPFRSFTEREVQRERIMTMSEEPLPTIVMGRGFHCVIPVTVGSQQFRMTVDTGAARSLIKTRFASDLRRSPKTRDSVVLRAKADRPVSCIGICQGMESPVLEHVTRLNLSFDEVSDGRGKPRRVSTEVDFAELEGASDMLLLGFPQIAEWGLNITRDDDGHVWVEFTKLGVTVLSEVIASQF